MRFVRWKETPEAVVVFAHPAEGLCSEDGVSHLDPWKKYLEKYLNKSHFISYLCSILEMSAGGEGGVCCLRETGTQLLHEAVSAEQGSEAETCSRAGQRNFRSALEKQTDLLETSPLLWANPCEMEMSCGMQRPGGADRFILQAGFSGQAMESRDKNCNYTWKESEVQL